MENIDVTKVLAAFGAFYVGKKLLGPLVFLGLAGSAIYLTVQYKQTGKLPEVPKF